ncbi:MAG: magnesium transporter [Candidatus Undinarchaeales archaeon]
MQTRPQDRNEQAVKESLFSRFAPSLTFLKESTSALLITIITTSLAGLFLSSYREFFLLLPGLIILVPGAVDMRGTIFGAMGARLGSAFHLGELEKITWKNEIIRKNTYSSILLSIFLPIMLAVLAKLISISFGIQSISVFQFIEIAFISSMISAGAMILVSFSIYEVASKKGWDPDNVTAPAITSMGDLITIPSLLVAGTLVLRLNPYVNWMAHATIIGAVILFMLTLQTKKDYRKLVLQALLILPFIALVEICSGVMLESYLERLAVIPATLILLPTFLGEGGNIGSIFASRLATSLHLGMTEPNYKMDKGTRRNLLNVFILCLIIFPAAGAAAHFLGGLFGLAGTNLLTLVLVSLTAGIILISVITMIVFGMAVFFYKKSVDPDNVLIPLLTAFADVFGVFCLLLVLGLFGII